MINFRYHVVSLTAVFLALAIGLVVGTAALNGPLSDNLKRQVNALSDQNTQYRSQVSQLITESKKSEEFASEAAPLLLQGRLKDQSVVLVSMEESNTYVGDLAETVALSGAKITGRIVVKDKFFDPKNNSVLLELAHSVAAALAHPGPLNSNGAETAGYLLAAILVNQTPAIPADVMRYVLKVFSEAGYLSVSDDFAGAARGIIFVAAQPYVDSSASGKNAAVLTVTDQFDKVGPMVVAANGVAGDGNIISEVRGDPTLSKTISTVDNVATPAGRIATTLATVEQVQFAKTGHYGTSGGANVVAAEADPVSRRGSLGALALAGIGGYAARAALRAIAAQPRAAALDRTNFRGRTVTLAGGPALAVAAAGTGALGAGSVPAAGAVLVAGLGSGAVGLYDDVVGARPEQRSAKGFRGHLGALRHGRVTAGLVKIVGVGAAGLAASALLSAERDRRGAARLVDVALGAGLIAGTANLVNLLDLRPGRALKAGLLIGAPLAAGRRGTLVAGPLGAAGALLPADLGEEIMLGDAGANALGAVLGVALAARTGPVLRAALLAGVAGLTAASERVSFTAVIERTPGLRELDALGRHPG